jgi:hypothetical protein
MDMMPGAVHAIHTFIVKELAIQLKDDLANVSDTRHPV